MEYRACEGCLNGSENATFHTYYIKNEVFKTSINKKKLTLCFVCRRIASKMDLFIENVKKIQEYLEVHVPCDGVMDKSCNIKPITKLTKSHPESLEMREDPKEIVTHLNEEHEIKSEMHNDDHESNVSTDYKNEEYATEHSYENDTEASRLGIVLKSEYLDNNDCGNADAQAELRLSGNVKTKKKFGIVKQKSDSKIVSTHFDDATNGDYTFDSALKHEFVNDNAKEGETHVNNEAFGVIAQRNVQNKKRKKKLMSSVETLEEPYEMIYLTEEQCTEERKKMSSQKKYQSAPYKCESCIKGYVYRESYDKHMVAHSKASGDHQCNICRQRRKTKELMLKHEAIHFRQYSCKLCKYTRLSRVSIQEHYNATHSARLLYECSACDKKYWKKTLLKKHIAYRHGDQSRVACDICGKTYVNAYSLRTHVNTVHATETSAPALKKEHVCVECGAAFRHASHLRAHGLKHSNCKEFYCVECDKSFKSESTLRQHLRLAAPHATSEGLPYGCEDCGEKFASSRSRAAHRNKVHLHAKPYQCKLCDKAYHSGWALAGHTKYAHDAPERKHACTFCDRVFNRKYVLLLHIRTHTGERPHRCALCPAAFAQRGVLGRHARTHRDLDRAKPSTG